MTPRRLVRLTLLAAVTLLLGACTATPITLPLREFGAGPLDAAMMADAGHDFTIPDLDQAGGKDGPGQWTDGGITMDAAQDGWTGDVGAGDAEAGPTEGGITEGGPTEGGLTDLAGSD